MARTALWARLNCWMSVHDLSFGFLNAAVIVFGARHIHESDRRDGEGRLYAIIRSVAGPGAMLALRLNPAAAVRQANK